MYPVKRRKKMIETADDRIRGPKASSSAASGAAPAGVLPLALLEIVTYKKAAAAAVKAFEQPASSESGKDKKTADKKPKRKEKDIASGKETATSAVPARTIDVAQVPVGKSRIAHLEQVKLRLRFLEYALCNSSLAISTDGVDLLWDCFITQALCSAERELAFAFLEKPNQNADGYPILPESVLQHIFSNKMLKIDGSQLSMAGYRLFERYFVTLNEKNSKVKRIQPASADVDSSGVIPPAAASFVALASDLIGFENLWDIALSSEDPTVADVAVEFLNNLHATMEAAGVSKTRALKLRDDYVRSAIDQLNQAAAKQNSKRLERCFILLRNFVLDFEVRQQSVGPAASASVASQLLKKKILPSASTAASGVSNASVKATLSKIWLKCSSKPSQRLVLNPDEVTVRAFREKAMDMFGFDSTDALQFLVDDEKDKELKELDRLLADYKVTDQTSVYINKVDSIAMVEEAQNGTTSIPPGNPELTVSNLMMGAMPFLFGGMGLTADAFKALAKRGINSAAAPSDSATEARSGSLKSVGGAVGAAPVAVPVFNSAPAVVLRPLTSPLKMDLKRTEAHPARLISGQQYFDKCYGLLGGATDEAMARQVWELLSLLPRNDALVRQLEDAAKASLSVGIDGTVAADSSFAQFFESKSVYQVTYNLQLVESILGRDAEAPATATADATPWRDIFSRAGLAPLLVKHLVARTAEASLWTAGIKRLVSQLLRVLVLLVLERDSTKGQQQGDAISFEAFKVRADFANSSKLHIISQLMVVVRTSALRGSSVFIPQEQGAEQDLDTLVAQEALTLLVPLITGAVSNLNAFCREADLQEWIASVLLKAPQNNTREAAARALSAILSRAAALAETPSKRSKSSKKLATADGNTSAPTGIDGAFFLSMLLPVVETDEIEQYSEVCDQYFNVMETLFSSLLSGINSSSLVRKFSKKIIRHPTVEQHATAGVEDKVLIGLMKLVLAIIRQDSDLKESSGKLLVREIMHEALFAIPTAETHHKTAKNSDTHSSAQRDPPKCKTRAARRTAFALLVELAKDCPSNFKTICDVLLNQADSIDMQNEYSFSSSSKEKSLCGYIGLQNQGATCYMNSLMQQLFCIPEFRQGILLARESDEVIAADAVAAERAALKAAEKGAKEGGSEVVPVATVPSTGPLLKGSVLYQIQRMFAFLQESEKRYFDTKEFCLAYKDPDGKPINTSQQMDANEYFQRLFDLLEKRLKGSNQESILQRVFGGGLSNQLIPTECQHRRAREEPFFNIGVEIKNKSDLRESLQLFVEGELLSGDNKFNCEDCGKPVETLKRACIEKLPPVLVVQLKRFEFNYEKMKNEKLNTACSFPMELDMEPYTKEGLARRESNRGLASGEDVPEMKPPSYYQYELCGIVVHTGSADFGHYYSYIRERVPQFGSKERRWFEFNDTIVTPFDPNRIPFECFGGEEEIIEWADLARTQKRKVKRQKPYNAYILFYERKGICQPQLTLEQIRLLTPQPSAEELRRSRLNQHKRNFSADDLGASAEVAESQESDNAAADERTQGDKSHRRSTSVDIRSSGSKQASNGEKTSETLKSSSPSKGPLDSSESSSDDEAPREEPPTRVSSNDAEAVDQTKASLRRSALRRSRRNADTEEPVDEAALGSAHLVAERISSATTARSSASESSMKNFKVGARAAMFVAKLAVASKKRKQEAAGNLALASGISLEELELLQLGSGQRLTGRRCEVGGEILNSIWEDNSMFLIRKQLFDQDYFSFVWQLSNLYGVGFKAKLTKKREASDQLAADTSLSLKRLIPADQKITFDLAGEVDRDRAAAAAAEAQARAAREAASQSVMGGLSSMASSIFGGGSSSSGSSGSSGSTSGAIPGTSSKDKIKVDYKGDRAKEEALNARERQKAIEKEKLERERREKEKEKERAAGLEDIPAEKDAKKDSKEKDSKDKEKDKEKDKKDSDKEKDKDKDKEKEKEKGKDKDKEKNKDKKKDKDAGIDADWTDIGDGEKKSGSKKDKEKDKKDKEKDSKEEAKKDKDSKDKEKDKSAPKTESASNTSESSSGHKKRKSNTDPVADPDTPVISRIEQYDPILHNVEMGTRFVLQILSHARDRPMLPYWISSLTRMFHSSTTASRWFLESLVYDAEQLKNVLLACPAEKVRQATARLIFAAIETLADEEHSKYIQTAKLLAQGPLTDPPAPSTVIWFMDKLLTTMIRMAKRKSSLNVDQLFWVIAQFARLGVHERHYLLKQGILVTLTDFARHYSDRSTPITRYNSPAQQHLTWLLDCVGTVLLSCKMAPDTSPSQPPTSVLGDKHSLSLPDADYEASFAKSFLYTMMREEVNIDAMGAILYHSCWENAAMSKFVLGIVQDGLIRMNWTAFNGFLNMFAVVSSIQDSIADDRVDLAIDKFLVGMKDAVKSTNRRAIEKLIAFMIKLSNESELFRRKLLRRRTGVNEILSVAGYRLSAV